MSYDGAGRVVSTMDPMSQTSTFSFNSVGQPLEADLPDETISYNYGGNGRTSSVTDSRGTTTFSYESGNDRVASITDPVTGTVSYTYAATGERLTMGLPGGDTWTYNYGTWLVTPSDQSPDQALHVLTQILDDQGRDVRYVLDATGRMHEAMSDISYVGGSPVSYVKTTYTYDNSPNYSRGRIAQVQNSWNWLVPMTSTWNSSLLVENDYTYDDAGNRTENDLSDSSGPIRSELYGYDELNRLTSVDYGDGETQSYTFDDMGNRLSKSDTTTSTVSESYTYNNANMLLTRGSNSYTNDANGNTLTGGGRSNTWDGENRLTQCVFSGTTTTYIYSADGYQRQTVNGSSTTDFILDGDNVVRSALGGVTDKTYFYGARGPEYERAGTADPEWYLYDGLGSVLGTVSPAGVVTHTRKYDVYGAVRGSTGGSGTPHKWCGALGHPSEDDTGLVYMRARHYDPVIGRFCSEDSARDGLNWYSYCSANPVNGTDSTGNMLDVLFGSAWSQMNEDKEGAAAQAAKKWGEEKIEDSLAYWGGQLMGAIVAAGLDTGEMNISGVSGGYATIDIGGGQSIGIDFVNHPKDPHIDIEGDLRNYLQKTYRLKTGKRFLLFARGFLDSSCLWFGKGG